MKRFRQYLNEERNVPKYKQHDYIHETDPEYHQEHCTQAMHFGCNDYLPFSEHGTIEESFIVESVEEHPHNPKELIFRHNGAGKATSAATGIVVPKHMWTGGKQKGGGHFDGMDARNEMRAKVYGGENRPPLSLTGIEAKHKEVLANHFVKPVHEQIHAEKEALGRIRKAGHLSNDAYTTDVGEKTDTVHHEYDEKGRSFIARSSKGVAGHAIYTSGHKAGGNEQHHIITTCPKATKGCGGGIDAHGIADTHKGTCFAPKAEHQYPGAAIKRAAHEQAKFDPAMTSDWVLAHAHSMRTVADKADKQNKRFLFRPNVVDETDRSSRHVIKHLNAQRAGEGKPPIVANSYGKTNELHDPDNHYHVTYSNVGPKVKHGAEISENRQRDVNRIRQTISATQSNGKDIVNDEGKSTPTKNSYMVINAQRGGKTNQDFEKHITHIKYWSGGRKTSLIPDHEKAEPAEGHYDGNGKSTTPALAHYGHKTITGTDGTARRYDYQKQHVLHPRLVETDDGKGKKHMIPTDSRFKDDDFLPKNRFKSKNGKNAGAVLITTPTISTSEIQHHSSFTHDVSHDHIEHAKAHSGEYEIDKPEHQEAAQGKEYQPPEAPAEHEPKVRVKKAVAKSKISIEQKRLAKHFQK